MRRRIGTAGAAAALVAMLGTAPGALAADAVYGGSTNGYEPIVINADKAGKKLRSAVIGWRADCGGDKGYFADGSAVAAAKRSPGFSAGADDLVMTRNGKRRFSGTQELGFSGDTSVAAATIKLDGKLGAKSASGTLSATVAIADLATRAPIATCQTGRLRWKATRAPGRVYGGKTSQNQPVVARVDAKRKRVTNVLVSWESSSCQPEPGKVHFGESLTNFGIASTGRFADTWASSEPMSDGGKVQTSYALTGRVSRRSTSGTLHFGVTWLDPAGASTQSCDSGNVTWKAATG
jgi:hypothetical protein